MGRADLQSLERAGYLEFGILREANPASPTIAAIFRDGLDRLLRDDVFLQHDEKVGVELLIDVMLIPQT